MSFDNLFKLIKKFAVLSDEQYKAILRNPQIMALLDKTDRLDEFYRSMPEIPIEEIYNRIYNIIEKTKVKREVPNFALKFIEDNGDRLLANIIIGQVKNYYIDKSETLSDQEVIRYGNYIEEINIAKFLKDYVSSATYEENKLKSFIFFYDQYLDLYYKEDEERDEKYFAKVISKLVRLVLIMLNSIFASEVFEDEVIKKLMRAYNIRRSDYFDFLNGGDIKVVRDEAVRENLKEKPELPDRVKEYTPTMNVPYDYRDEATKK
jgi:hypothetical protein